LESVEDEYIVFAFHLRGVDSNIILCL
jgi:hypothetical protein